jgi:hypothetical protein
MDDKDREKISDAIDESQSDFEKNLVYLSAGALALSIGFIEKVIKLQDASSRWLLIASWGLLASTLLLNLASHLISVRNSTKAREEMDKGTTYEILVERISCRNKIMRTLNWVTYGFFALGVIFTVVFCSINFSNYG